MPADHLAEASPRDEVVERRLTVHEVVECAACEWTGWLDDEPGPCKACSGNGRLDSYTEPTRADLAVHLRTLPHAEQVAALVALLRECPDAAVEAVNDALVARPWVRGSDHCMQRFVCEHLTRECVGREPLAQVYTTVAYSDPVSLWHTDSVGRRRGEAGTEAEAMAAADAALLADGWVLASGVPRVG